MPEARHTSTDDGLDDDPFRGPLLPRYLVLLLVAGLVLVPIVATVLGGFKDLGELRTNPFGLPRTWHVENYWGILSGGRYWRMIFNSLVIASFTTALVLVAAGLAAFVFAHLRFAGDRYLLNYFLIGLLFPAATAILPLFIKVRDLGCSTPTPAWCCRPRRSRWARRSCCFAISSSNCPASCSTRR